MSNSKLSKQGQAVSMYCRCRILLLQWKPKVGYTKPSTGPYRDPRGGHKWLRSICVLLLH